MSKVNLKPYKSIYLGVKKKSFVTIAACSNQPAQSKPTTLQGIIKNKIISLLAAYLEYAKNVEL
jgi:hypothetical protein